MKTHPLQDRLRRLDEASPGAVALVNIDELDPDQLVRLEDGLVLRVESIGAVQWIGGDHSPAMGCIAGWISEDDL